MKKYIKYLTTLLFTFLIIFFGSILLVLLLPRGRFKSSYQNVIVDKYRILQKTNSPKIIIVSGSSSSFGLNQKMLEEASGYKVVNLGLHAGFGPLFYTELSKENINSGDIVLLGYEYDWTEGFDFMNQELIMTGIDDNIDMYKHIPLKKWPDFIGYLPQYAQKKLTFGGATGIYSREAFDPNTAQMTMSRPETMVWSKEAYGTVDLKSAKISPESINYLKKYKQYVENKGAKVYFVSPPVVKDAINFDPNLLDELKKNEERKIGIPFISNPQEYIFPCELMSNANYHCNDAGEIKRTELLINDLRHYNIIK